MSPIRQNTYASFPRIITSFLRRQESTKVWKEFDIDSCLRRNDIIISDIDSCLRRNDVVICRNDVIIRENDVVICGNDVIVRGNDENRGSQP